MFFFVGHIDHAARVMRVITWNRSFKGAPNGDNGNDEYDEDKYETHATVLDKLLAWEKKLYEEVKVCFSIPKGKMVILHQRKRCICYIYLLFIDIGRGAYEA